MAEVLLCISVHNKLFCISIFAAVGELQHLKLWKYHLQIPPMLLLFFYFKVIPKFFLLFFFWNFITTCQTSGHKLKTDKSLVTMT